jgi:methionine-S-sulfoxide reductase
MKTILTVSVLALSLSAWGAPKKEKKAPEPPREELATFCGGCFWCTESELEGVEGVKEVLSGYTGGDTPNPTYEAVSGGGTGHCEAVQVRFDPAKVSYEKILQVYWENIDPTDAGGQFVDRGSQYRTAVFVHSEAQRKAAVESKKKMEASKRFAGPIATEIRKASAFFPAEAYHQDFYKKKPDHYQRYKKGSGRETFKKKTWGEKTNEK